MKAQRIVSLLGALLMSQMAIGQTIVSTVPENKRPVLEEFGGMYCVYCPSGHQIVEDMQSEYEDDLVILNYHTGIYAEPIGDDLDLRSPIGQVIDDQTGLTGYPAGTVNRKVFEGYEQGEPGTTALSRAHWDMAAGLAAEESAPVNIAAEATLNLVTRQLDLYIEYYYTDDAGGINNRLNVAVLQNNVLAPQLGGGAGSYYPHQHVVRDMLTGQWGHIIETTDAGTFGSLTYSLILPVDYNGVWVDPVNIELAIFIAKDHQRILNGIRVEPEIVTDHADDVHLLAIIAPEDICGEDLGMNISFRNDGHDILQSVMIEYGISGGSSDIVEWTGDLQPLAGTNYSLGTLPPDWEATENEFYVHLWNPNGETDPTELNNARTHRVSIAPPVPSFDLELVLRTDNFGYELYWEVIDDFGTIHASGGNEVVAQTGGGAQIATPNDPGTYGNNAFMIEQISLPAEGCYQFRILDDYADGLCCYYGNGFYRLRIPGQSPFFIGGEFGAVEERLFSVDFTLVDTDEEALTEAPTVFPNPLLAGQDARLKGTLPNDLQWVLWDASGRQLDRAFYQGSIPTSQLPAGFYYLELSDGVHRWNLPLIIQR